MINFVIGFLIGLIVVYCLFFGMAIFSGG